MHLFTSRFSHFALLLLLAGSSLMGFSRVLCVGADGHSEIELVQDGSCHADACAPVSADVAVGLLPADGCGPCTDFLLDQALSLDLWRTSFQLAPPVLSTTFAQRLPLALWTTPLFAQPPPAHAASLRALRSVRLLI